MSPDEPRPDDAADHRAGADRDARDDGPAERAPDGDNPDGDNPDGDTASAVTDDDVGRGGRGGRSRHRHPGRWIAAGILLVLAVAVAWVAVTAVLARGDLNAARSELSAARRDILAGDLSTARQQVDSARHHAHRAHHLTTGPAWATAAAIPYFGDPLDTVRGVTAGADAISGQVLPQLVDAADGIDPSRLLAGGGQINLSAIQRIGPGLTRATSTTVQVRQRLELLPSNTWLSPVDDGRRSLIVELSKLQSNLQSADLAARVVPPLLGAQRPQRYFVGLLNSAESRGVGGLPGAFVILVADHGRLRITHFESDDRLRKVASGVDLGKEFASNYAQADPTGTYTNSTISPHFPYAAQIWAGMWQQASGEKVDGAIALDPTALSLLLRATGPAKLRSGEAVTADNVVALTEKTAYSRYPEVSERKQFLLDIARAVDDRILTSHQNPVGLLRAAGTAAGQRRLLLWTSNTTVENALATLPLTGVLPDGPQPFAAPIVVNAAGGKLDYYLDRAMTWSATGCGDRRTVTVRITLNNDAPNKYLPGYVTTRLDNHAASAKLGDNRVLLRYYATTGARLTGVQIDGKPAQIYAQTERNHPVFLFDLELPRGVPHSVTLTLDEPGTGPPTIWTQPLVRPMTVSTTVPHCN